MAAGSVQAWLLDFGADRLAAVGLHELVEVLSRPRLYHVPMASPHCHQVLVWRDEILAVVDFRAVRDPATAGSPDEGAPVTAIAAYQPSPGEPLRHGAIELDKMPKTLAVDDSMACPLPASGTPLLRYALSCFAYENLPVPVVDVASVFEGRPRR